MGHDPTNMGEKRIAGLTFQHCPYLTMPAAVKFEKDDVVYVSTAVWKLLQTEDAQKVISVLRYRLLPGGAWLKKR
jgi:hypothetical protein